MIKVFSRDRKVERVRRSQGQVGEGNGFYVCLRAGELASSE